MNTTFGNPIVRAFSSVEPGAVTDLPEDLQVLLPASVPALARALTVMVEFDRKDEARHIMHWLACINTPAAHFVLARDVGGDAMWAGLTAVALLRDHAESPLAAALLRQTAYNAEAFWWTHCLDAAEAIEGRLIAVPAEADDVPPVLYLPGRSVKLPDGESATVAVHAGSERFVYLILDRYQIEQLSIPHVVRGFVRATGELFVLESEVNHITRA